MLIEITPQAVKAAYEKYPHIEPIDGVFDSFHNDGELCGACALSILAIDALGEDGYKKALEPGKGRFETFIKLTGQSEEWLWSIVHGFDGSDQGYWDVKEAHKIGAESRKLVFPDGSNTETP